MKVADVIGRLVWEEVGRNLAREGGVKKALCLGEDFRAYLNKEAKLPFKLEKTSPKVKGGYGLVIGWGAIRLERIHGLLRKDGEARLWGFYSRPRPEDLAKWEGKLRKVDGRAVFPKRLPGAMSLARLSARVKQSPFEHYTIRKQGIYYQALLKK